jgi:hypothetical protein
MLQHGTWRCVDACPALCLILKPVREGTRSAGYQQWLLGPPQEMLRSCRWCQSMRTCLSWIQPHPHGAILRHLLNMVNSFLCFSTKYFENRLLPNDLFIIWNHGDDAEDEWDIRGCWRGKVMRISRWRSNPVRNSREFDFETNSESRTTLALN